MTNTITHNDVRDAIRDRLNRAYAKHPQCQVVRKGNRINRDIKSAEFVFRGVVAQCNQALALDVMDMMLAEYGATDSVYVHGGLLRQFKVYADALIEFGIDLSHLSPKSYKVWFERRMAALQGLDEYDRFNCDHNRALTTKVVDAKKKWSQRDLARSLQDEGIYMESAVIHSALRQAGLTSHPNAPTPRGPRRRK